MIRNVTLLMCRKKNFSYCNFKKIIVVLFCESKVSIILTFKKILVHLYGRKKK